MHQNALRLGYVTSSLAVASTNTQICIYMKIHQTNNILYVQSVGFAWGSPTKISVKLSCWFIKWKFIGTVKYADPVLASSLTLRADHYLTPILTAILPLLPGLLTVKRESCVTDTRQSLLPLSNFGPVPKPLEELQTRGRYQCFHTGLTTICNADCTCRG